MLGGPLSLGVLKTTLLGCWDRLREKCIGSCSSGSAGVECDINTGDFTDSLRGGSLPGNMVVSSLAKPSPEMLASLAGLFASHSAPSSNVHAPTSALHAQNTALNAQNAALNAQLPPSGADRSATDEGQGKIKTK